MPRLSKLQFGGGLMAAVLIALAGHSLLDRYTATHTHQKLLPSAVISHSTNMPNERIIDTASEPYRVAADMPRLITIPGLGASGFIQQVSMDTASHEMAVPTNIHLAGWYTGSAKPGDPGLSIIDGHVSGHYQAGIFTGLSKLEPRNQFTVSYGDGSSRAFEVVSATSYSVREVSAHLLEADPAIAQQLNLITCGGKFNDTTHQYENRILVVARRTS